MNCVTRGRHLRRTHSVLCLFLIPTLFSCSSVHHSHGMQSDTTWASHRLQFFCMLQYRMQPSRMDCFYVRSWYAAQEPVIHGLSMVCSNLLQTTSTCSVMDSSMGRSTVVCHEHQGDTLWASPWITGEFLLWHLECLLPLFTDLGVCKVVSLHFLSPFTASSVECFVSF